MILCISVLSVVISSFFIILLIWFSPFFLMNLANGLSILFIFSKNQLLVLLIFAIVSFVSFSFISALIFMIFFSFYSPWGSSFLLFLVALGAKLGYLFDFSLVSWGKLVWLWTFCLALLLLNPIGCHFFIFICFYARFDFLWCLLWFDGYSEVLFSLHMFVFLIFFSYSWHLIIPHCDQKRCLKWFQVF